MKDKVLKFISRFTLNEKREQVIDAFESGCCYWFAFILLERFHDPDAWREDVELMYDPVVNHFGCRIDGIVYDISGDVSDKYNWIEFDKMDDDLVVERLFRDCINF